MATQIYNDSTQVICVNTVDNSKIVCLDLFTFAFREHSTDVYILDDGKGTGIKIRLTDAIDVDGNTFSTSADLVSYLSEMSRSTANFGTSIQLDNMKIINTGSQLKYVDQNRGITSFMVQQRVTDSGTQKVYYVEQSDAVIHENSSNAFQGISAHQKTATVNAQGRYVLVIDLQILNNTFIHEYRAKVLNDGAGNGINNLNIKIFNVTTNPPVDAKYRTLTGTDIDAGWHISQNAHFNLLRDAVSDTNAGFDIPIGDTVSLDFEEGFTLEAGEHYRFVISGDNAFVMEGVEGAPNPFKAGASGTQFIPYIERSFSGQAETEVVTDAPKIYRDAIDFSRDSTNTNITTSRGDSYNVNAVKAIEDNGTIKIVHINLTKEYYKEINHELVTIAGQNVSGGASDVVNALNALFTVTQGQLSTSITSPQVDALGTATTNNNYSNVIDPVGDASFALGSGTHGVVYTDEKINEPGEYFAFSILGKNYHGIGLVDDTTDTDGNGISDHLAELQSQTTNRYFGNIWSMWIHPTVASWTYYGEQSVAPTVSSGFSNMEGNTSSDANIRWQTSVEYQNLATTPVGMKVGINNLGYLVVYYFNVAENRYIPIVRFTATLPSRNYRLYYAMGNASSQMWDAPKVHLIDEAAPVLAYYAIQSVDWKYPLFPDAEQANYYDSQNGGSGTSTTQVFPDDPTNTQWYVPDNGFTSDGTSVPQNTDSITWNVIPSETIVPDAFTSTIIEVNEGATFNIPIDPADHNWNTTISGENWGSLSGDGLNLVGTAPTVADDYVDNPNDEYVFTVTRTLEGSSTGTVTIRVINLTAPVNPISGFNHISGTTAMVDSNTMGDGSVVQVNTTVADEERFVIEQSYIETNILPNLTETGDSYIIGLHNTASDFSTLEIADFDACIVWSYVSATSHKFTFYRDGVIVQNQNGVNADITINSLTDAYYDYAIECDGTSAWLIACNINSIMNEPSPNDGGQFSHYYEVTNTEDTAPIEIHIAALNTTADISTTGIETITTPTAPATTTTPFNKAVDFSGGSEYLVQVNSSYLYAPLKMGGASSTVAAPTSGNTVSSGHPWATAIVFKSDFNSSNQHIWNSGEGATNGDDNIYLRTDANGLLYFGWGRDGVGYNECRLGGQAITGWRGIYIANTGERLSGNNATAANLADCFEIRIANESNNWVLNSDNLSTTANWISTGVRMDRAIGGDFTIGGRGSNRNWHGKITSMVITTLRCGVAMPDDTEIEMMLSNPIRWVEDYKIGNAYRRPSVTTDTNNFALNSLDSANGTQVLLMGDGSLDNYNNGIRNYIYPTEQNRTKFQFMNMASNDVQTISDPIN